MDEKTCLLCRAEALRLIPGYAHLPRVASDTKPWPAGGTLMVCEACGMAQKPPSAHWLSEIGEIYNSYDSFHLSDVADQVIFDAGARRGRTSLLVDYVIAHGALPASGDLIDIGCGKGAALANFSAALPGWKLYANELSDGVLPRLRKIPRFEKLYVGDVAGIAETFAVVTLIHSLEHLIDPIMSLAAIRDKVRAGGKLVVEVPDVANSPFDLLVADHRSHFTGQTLKSAVQRAGFDVSVFSDSAVPKELTLMATPATTRASHPADATGAVRTVEAAVRWLTATTDELRRHMDKGPVAIFGTAVAGMAMYGVAPDRIAGFVDEDANRQGKSYDGKPVYAPANVPEGVTVFIPLAPQTAAKVAARLRQAGVTVAEPPPFA